MKIDNLNMEAEEEQAVVKPRVTNSILDGFELLKEQEVEKKVTGGFKILVQVTGDKEEKVKDRDYVLKRLVRSLGANVPEVRSGYFATLVALLCKHESITITQVLELVKKELHANGSSKSEVGDVALGQILVCGTIFRSGRMLLCEEEQQQQVIQLFLNALRKKSYLSTVAYLLLLDFVSKLDAEQFTSIIWSRIKDEFKKDIKEHTLDSLYFLMVVANKFPEKVKLRKLIGVSEVLCEDNIPDICEKIMSGIDFNTVGHPIYTEIAGLMANSPNLKTFWLGIDNQLVKHNRNRELVSLNMLTTILRNLKENYDIIPDLLSKNSFKLFMDWFKGLQTASKVRNKRDDEDDRKIMVKTEKELLKVLSETLKSDKVDNSVRVEVLKKLLFNPGEINFTEITGTTIVKSIIADLDEHSVKKFAKSFKGVLLNTTKKQVKEGVERSWYNNERLKAAELISHLVNQEAVKDNTEFKLTYMKLLMCFGFFKVGGEENISITKDLAVRIKLCFYRCFTARSSNVDNLVTILSSLCSFICDMLENEDVRSKLEKQFDKENMECWQVVIEICKPIEGNKSKSKIDKVFLILLYQLGLFLFSEPDHVKIAKESIRELKSCHEHVKKDKKISKKKDRDLSQDEEPEWIEVLVEVLLSILSVESFVLRSVVQCVFRLLWEHLTPSAVGQIVSVLDPESESDPLTQDSDSEEENGVDGNDDSNEEDESDKEEEEESDDTDNESDGDADENDMKTPDQLRMAVQKALGANATESDAESLDADMITEEDGNKLDSALAEAFKQFHQGKGKQRKKERKDKKSLSDFRIRVLDLVDIYLDKEPSMDVCLAMIAPLTRCLEFCIQDNQLIELEKRVRKTIKTLTSVRRFNSTEDTTVEILTDYLSAALDKGSRSQYSFKAIGNVVTQFATFIIHCSLKVISKNGTSPKKSNSSDLVKVVKEATQNYFTDRKCQLPIILFHYILRIDWEGGYKVASVISENIFNNEVRQFRRNEGLDLLSTFFQSLKRKKPTGKAVTSLSKLEQGLGDSIMKALSGDTEVAIPTKFLNGLSNVINAVKSLHTLLNTTPALDVQSLHEKIITAKAADKNIKKTVQKENNAKKLQENKTEGDQENGIQKRGKKQKSRKRKEGVMNGHVQPQQKKKRTNSVVD